MKKVFISKEGQWFKKGSIAIPYLGQDDVDESVLKEGFATFTGILENKEGARMDQETCSTDEFDVIEVEENVYQALNELYKLIYNDLLKS